MKYVMLLLSVVISNVSVANYLGNFGPTFAILEPDFLAEIQAKLNHLVATGEIKQHQINMQNKVTASVHRPTPVAGLSKTKVAKAFWYDPSILVPTDLRDHQGRVFIKSGTIVNPLDYYPLRQKLLFIDGDDPAQIAWAKKLASHGKIILVKGSPFKFSKEQQAPSYFDQHGKLIRKFGIRQIPAVVKQDGKRLKIVEVLLDA